MQKNDYSKTRSLDKYSILISVVFFIIIAYVTFFHHDYWTNGDYVIYSNLENILKADVIEMNLETKDTKIFMYEDKKKVNIKSKN